MRVAEGRLSRVSGAGCAFLVLFTLMVAVPPAAADPPALSCEWMSGAQFPAAIGVAPDGRVFYNELYLGAVRLLTTGGVRPSLEAVPFVTVADVNGTLEMGLLGITFDPDWNATPWLYVYYTAKPPTGDENRIVRYWAANATAGASEVILRGLPRDISHNGGIMKFGPDRKLYVAVGDALQTGLVQNNSTPNGKILRLNANGTIPSDNPTPGSAVFAMGFRSIFGMTFHPLTGTMYVTENGPNHDDEINIVRAGLNYGWPDVLGMANDSRFVDPLWNITPVTAPTGLAFDTSRFPARDHIDLYYGEFNTGLVHRIVLDAPDFDRVSNITRALDLRSNVLALENAPGGKILVTTVGAIFTFDPQRANYSQPVPAVDIARQVTFPGISVGFDAGRSADPDGDGISGVFFDFGDGNQSNGSTVSHAWGAPGNYTVGVTVADGCNYQASISRTVEVRDRSRNLPPVARLQATLSAARAPAVLEVNANLSSDPERGPLAETWTFGDGGSATGTHVTHTFETGGDFVVALLVTDELGATAVDRVTFTVLPPTLPPLAVFGTDTEVTTLGGPITFDASASFDPDGAIENASWDFGDGVAAEGLHVTHFFRTVGEHTVTLSVTDNAGVTTNVSRTFLVTPSTAGPVDPSAGIAAMVAALLACAILLARRR